MKAMQSFGHVSIFTTRLSHTFLRRLLDRAHDPALVSAGSNRRRSWYTALAAASDTYTAQNQCLPVAWARTEHSKTRACAVT